MKLARLAMTGIIVGSLLAIDTVASPTPDTVAEAKAQLDALQEELSAVEQEAIEAGSKAEEAQRTLERAGEDVAAQEAKVAQISDEIGEMAVMQLQQGSLDMTMQLLTSVTDDTFLSSLATIQSESERSNAHLQQFQNDQARLNLLREQAERAKREMDENLAELERKGEEFRAKEAEAQQVYDRLKAEELERLRRLQEQEERRRAEAAEREARQAEQRQAATEGGASRSEVRAGQAESTSSAAAATQDASAATQEAPAAAPVDGNRAQTVINAAMAQVGGRYRLGSAGPNAFDCSGLTYYAYRQAGISLPRSSRAQYAGAGRAVKLSQIQPGDLVFYYSGPSHVAIYIGGGKVVHAANPRSGINVAGLHSMPLKGVRRVL